MYVCMHMKICIYDRVDPLGRSGLNLEPGTAVVYFTNGSRKGLNIARKVCPCPGSRKRWVAFSRAVSEVNNRRPRFQVKARPS